MLTLFYFYGRGNFPSLPRDITNAHDDATCETFETCTLSWISYLIDDDDD